METTYYALRHRQTKALARCNTSANEGDFCTETGHSVALVGDAIWKADAAELALWVLLNPSPGYNAIYDTPAHLLKAAEWEVVRVTTIKKKKSKTHKQELVSVELPDPIPYWEFRVKTNERVQHIIDRWNSGNRRLDYYEVKRILAWKKTFAYKLHLLNHVLQSDE